MKSRNSSIELLRLICMLFIIAHHIIITTIAPDESSQLYNFIEQVLHTAVVVFVLISGYYGIRFSLPKLIKLETMVLFYSIIIGSIAFWGLHSIELRDYFDCFMPVSCRTYWFISAYIELYLFSPALNVLLDHISKRMHVLLILLLLYCSSILNYQGMVSQGSNLVYMSMMYLLGRYLYYYKNDMLQSYKKCLGGVICYLVFSIPFFFLPHNTSIFHHFWQFTYRYYGLGCIFMSILIFYFFKNIYFNSTIINRLAVSVLPIYLIHENHLVSFYIYELPTKMISNYIGDGWALVMCSVAVMIFCILADQIRIFLFDHIAPMFAVVSLMIERTFNYLFKILE